MKVASGYSGLIRRYLDSKKQRFSNMKSHDCHVMMTQLFPIAVRGIMDDHVRNTLIDFYNFFDAMYRKSISVRHLTRLQEEIISILCELEIYFPLSLFDVMVHLLVHMVAEVKDLGPTFLRTMFLYEWMNGTMKGYIHNKAHPDGCIV